jgi:hypothetical protein
VLQTEETCFLKKGVSLSAQDCTELVTLAGSEIVGDAGLVDQITQLYREAFGGSVWERNGDCTQRECARAEITGLLGQPRARCAIVFDQDRLVLGFSFGYPMTPSRDLDRCLGDVPGLSNMLPMDEYFFSESTAVALAGRGRGLASLLLETLARHGWRDRIVAQIIADSPMHRILQTRFNLRVLRRFSDGRVAVWF